LLLQQQLRRLDTIDRANEHLDQKALSLLQISALIVSLVGVFNIPAFLETSDPRVNYTTVVAFVAFIIMIILALFAWSPKNNPVPGPDRISSDAEDIIEWNIMLNKYVNVDEKTSFGQGMVNYIDVTERLRAINTLKTRLVQWAASLLVVQVACLAYIAWLAS
jgi:amino acid transporter